MFGEDEKDYGKLKEDRRQEREDTRHIEQCFKLGVGNDMDKMLAIVTGQYRPPKMEGEPDRITAPIQGNTARIQAKNAGYGRQQDDEEEERFSYGEAPKKKADFSQQMNKYSEITDVLDRFRFSSNDEKRKSQMDAIATAIKNAISNLIPQEVAQNTKKAFSKYISKFFKVSGGLQVVFAFGESKFAVTAKGAFYGDETLGVYRDKNDNLAPIVMRKEEDVSDQFDVSIAAYKGE